MQEGRVAPREEEGTEKRNEHWLMSVIVRRGKKIRKGREEWERGA